MLRAIAIKELRETGWIAALALVLSVWLVHQLTVVEVGNPAIPFNGDGFFPSVGLVLWGLAIALALRQSAWERTRGTYPFLLHRPAAVRAIFAAKIATGLLLLELVALVPIVSYAAWASTAGKHPSPFEWWMTESAWCVWLSLPVAYLAAFLSGLRPARWFGTRLFPLAGGAGLVVLFGVQTWPVALVGSLVVSTALLWQVFYIGATSDFS